MTQSESTFVPGDTAGHARGATLTRTIDRTIFGAATGRDVVSISVLPVTFSGDTLGAVVTVVTCD